MVVFCPAPLLTVAIETRSDGGDDVHLHAGGQGLWVGRMARSLGAEAQTVAGLCGLGDLVLTCSSPLSRNMRFGLALAAGRSVQEALDDLKPAVVEGVSSAPAVIALAARLGVEMPISESVAAIVAGEIGVDEAILGLLSRPIREE